MDSLYPVGSPIPHSGTVRVTLDGGDALQSSWKCFPTRVEEITIGKNFIGGSTCRSDFTGEILSVERFEKPRN
jgi:hypothetical protein